MRFNFDTLLKLGKIGSDDISQGLDALERMSDKASSIAKDFSEIVGQAKIVFQKAQSISKKLDEVGK